MWIKGTTNGHDWEAKVYGAGSRYGINGGPVSKLAIFCKPGEKGRGSGWPLVYNYDRGLDFDDCTPELLAAVVAEATQRAGAIAW